MPGSIIALLTDFGTKDGYVASMKAVILAIAPDTIIVDITHEIPPQNISQAAFILETTYQSFPTDTIFVVVVDPGVGTQRRSLLMRTPYGRFLSPDNGLLTYVLRKYFWPLPSAEKPFAPIRVSIPDECIAVALTNPAYWRNPVSSTFEGRDVFAAVAAHVARGTCLNNFGDEITTLNVLQLPQLFDRDNQLTGAVLHIDHFGNLVTNIPNGKLHKRNIQVQVGGETVEGLSTTYGEHDGLVALVGSHGYLEIALVGGNASEVFGIGIGTLVRVSSLSYE